MLKDIYKDKNVQKPRKLLTEEQWMLSILLYTTLSKTREERTDAHYSVGESQHHPGWGAASQRDPKSVLGAQTNQLTSQKAMPVSSLSGLISIRTNASSDTLHTDIRSHNRTWVLTAKSMKCPSY